MNYLIGVQKYNTYVYIYFTVSVVYFFPNYYLAAMSFINVMLSYRSEINYVLYIVIFILEILFTF